MRGHVERVVCSRDLRHGRLRDRRVDNAADAAAAALAGPSTGATADGERPSFTALASYLPAAGAMAWPMKANSRRRCIAAWARRGRSG